MHPKEPIEGTQGRNPERPANAGATTAPRPKPKPTKSKTRRKAQKPIPTDWKPLERHFAKAAERGVDCHLAAQKFQAHAESQDRRCADWNRAFDNWLLNERSSPSTPHQPRPPAFDAFERAKRLRDAERSSQAEEAQPQQQTTSLEQVQAVPIRERAQALISEPHKAERVHSHQWPEVVWLAESFSSALGWHTPRFPKPNGATSRMVELLAAFERSELEKAVAAAPSDKWLNDGAKGLTSLSVEVVGRLLNAANKPKQSEANMSIEDIMAKRRADRLARELGLI